MQNSAVASQNGSTLSQAPAQLLDLAFDRLKAGDAGAADAMVIEALGFAPSDPDAWNLAGMTAQALGAHKAAIERFDSAARLAGAHPVILTCRARSELALGQRDAALASLTEAVAKPGASAETMTLLAGVLLDLGRLDAAGHAVLAGLSKFPGQPHLMVLKGRLLAGAGERDAALDAYRKAYAAEPALRDAYRFAAVELFAARRYDDAAAHLAKALELNSSDIETWVNFSTALERCGRPGQARGAARQALALRPGHGPALDAMARAVSAEKDPAITDQLLADIAAGFASFNEPEGALVTLTMNILYRQTEFLRLRVALHERDWRGPLPVEEAIPADRRALLYQLTHDAFAQLFARRPIPCWDTERVFASLRAAFLALDAAGALDAEAARTPACQALLVMMARQAHLTEHLSDISETERGGLPALRDKVAALGSAAPSDITAGDWARIALLAAYEPLAASAPGLAPLAAAEATPAPIRAILEEQILAPDAEAALAPSIESALPETDAGAASARVRAQYEAHPYPRWSRMAAGGVEPAGRRMADVLGVMRAEGAKAGAPYRVLIAGSGTGAQPIQFARRFAHAEVLAVDLSRASLAYATRKARALGVDNIRFLQADLLALPEGPHFEEIHCSGVLHHLADPEAGLKALTARLAPRGLMHLALYSRIARREIAAAREAFAKARPDFDPAAAGVEVGQEDLRAFRRWVAAEAPEQLAAALPGWVDFYTASMLRDLMFPAQETSYRLSEIRSMLARAGLRFCAFDLHHDPAVLAAFDKVHPGARDDLDAWEAFESERPSSFRYMYRLWVQKA